MWRLERLRFLERLVYGLWYRDAKSNAYLRRGRLLRGLRY